MKRLSEKVLKPWGAYHDMAEEDGKWHLKVIEVKKGSRLSLQKHKLREEFWLIVEGRAKVQQDDKVIELGEGDEIYFGKGQLHRIEGLTDVVFVEVSFGEHKEIDIERLEDDYSRK